MYWNFVVADLASDLWLHLLGAAAMSAIENTCPFVRLVRPLARLTVWAVNMQLGQILPYLDCRQPCACVRDRFVCGGGRRLPCAPSTSWRVARPAGDAPNAPARHVLFRRSASALAGLVFHLCAFDAGHRRRWC